MPVYLIRQWNAFLMHLVGYLLSHLHLNVIFIWTLWLENSLSLDVGFMSDYIHRNHLTENGSIVFNFMHLDNFCRCFTLNWDFQQNV